MTATTDCIVSYRYSWVFLHKPLQNIPHPVLREGCSYSISCTVVRVAHCLMCMLRCIGWRISQSQVYICRTYTKSKLKCLATCMYVCVATLMALVNTNPEQCLILSLMQLLMVVSLDPLENVSETCIHNLRSLSANLNCGPLFNRC